MKLKLIHDGMAYRFEREDGSLFEVRELVESDRGLLVYYLETMLAAVYADPAFRDSKANIERRFIDTLDLGQPVAIGGQLVVAKRSLMAEVEEACGDANRGDT